ncbi:hypothetical protein GCM10022410_13550 [Amphibacillus indicireducens]|uniref:Uncharacterized protein n=1 Tax=Amphibacillus indicireducens TaxID=1076330 RepID=A0ABP7VJZ7_9BACI
MFKTINPLVAPKISEQDEIQDTTVKITEFCKEPKTRKETQEFLDIQSRSYLNQKIMRPLIK